MDDASNAHDDTGQPQGEPGEDGHSRNLRTILLLDICDSTGIVERLGDTATAQLFREHDRLVLRLQQAWRGRLIDRSDGLLLLFERPMDGLGFALDYGQGLAGIGKLRDIELKARAGLHVGELLTWRNSEESVRLGAKPLEVEGLAKPMAARLMSIARPGQILMSAVAESLTHRAVRDMGERGLALVWKSHGRWRFKGMPETQEVFEVGEPGIAPLRRPIESAKAQRAVPLWRRPTAMAAEAALVAAIAVGGWFATRPPPAIAFSERDWVVVGDLRNLTGDAGLEDSLEQAFRISLEQSRHVNVLSDLKVRDTLARMRLAPDTVVDRDIAAQIAQRDGARAVILPTVSEVGGRLRMSVEVVDPHSQATVYAHAADGKGEASVLASIDEVTGALRADLGEAVAQIDKDSRPLPEVTTGNLDALRAYALGQEAFESRDFDQARRLFERATVLDEQFALAWLGIVRADFSQVNANAALDALLRAKQLVGHLPAREALYVEAWAARFLSPADATGKWTELARLYPDFYPGQGNAALWLYEENRFEEALPHVRAAAVSQNPLLAVQFDTEGRILLALERYEEAAAALRRANSMSGGSIRRLVGLEAAQRRFAQADAYLKQLEPGDPYAHIEMASVSVDRGDWAGARNHAANALTSLRDSRGLDSRYLQVPLALSEWLSGDQAGAEKRLLDAADGSLEALSKKSSADAQDDAATVLAAALVLARQGKGRQAERLVSEVARYPRLMETPPLEELATVVRAQQSIIAGKPGAAIEQLERLLSGWERYQTRATLMRAYVANGDHEKAIREAGWLQKRRGLAYAELECGYCLQALNVFDSTLSVRQEARSLDALGRPEEAAARLAEFEELWPNGAPAYLR
ncbi:putative peptide modification system cyclase [Marilutibacter spongiae]|uniref:Putative peptide modification system cyclase n=1 Tax=Marilutibacter spongiae TaxID=2025720 RepID=A0A7W3Y6R8_9GAMM|nr:putative peptide modification system cyclase [Lysobacter spongiae]MBB1061768.1 putative peptide modification system cyclase [Lysobacter spongiae]